MELMLKPAQQPTMEGGDRKTTANEYLNDLMTKIQTKDPSLTCLVIDQRLLEPFLAESPSLSTNKKVLIELFCWALQQNEHITTVSIGSSAQDTSENSETGRMVEKYLQQILETLNTARHFKRIELRDITDSTSLASRASLLQYAPNVKEIAILLEDNNDDDGKDEHTLQSCWTTCLQKHTALERIIIFSNIGKDSFHDSEDFLANLCAPLGEIPALQEVQLQCNGRVFCSLPPECLAFIMQSRVRIAAGSPRMRLHLQGWTLSDPCMRALSTAVAENGPLEALSISHCRCKEVETPVADDNTKILPSGAEMALSLATNKQLKSLVFQNTRVPLSFWQQLPVSLAHNSMLQQLEMDDVFLSAIEMSHWLDAVNQLLSRPLSTLQKISIPIVFGVWTESLQDKLKNVLNHGKGQLQSIKLRLQALPATSCYNQSPECRQRQQVWSIWKEFLASSNQLQELEVTNLTQAELLDLADLVVVQQQQRLHQQPLDATSNLTTFRLHGDGVKLETLTRLVHRLSSCNKTQLRTFLNFTLFHGEEQRSNEVSHLAQAVASNFVTEGLTIKCSEYTSTPHEDITNLYREQGKTIQSVVALNQAGRRYLLQDPSNIHQGVSVLSQVCHDLDGIIYHLIENPSLCQQLLPPSRGTKRKCQENFCCCIEGCDLILEGRQEVLCYA